MKNIFSVATGIVAMSVLAAAATGFISVASADTNQPLLIDVALERWSLPDVSARACNGSVDKSTLDCASESSAPNVAADLQSSVEAAQGMQPRNRIVDDQTAEIELVDSQSTCANKVGDRFEMCQHTLPLLRTLSWVYR